MNLNKKTTEQILLEDVVAKALWQHEYPNVEQGEWKKVTSRLQNVYIERARAAIEALKDPRILTDCFGERWMLARVCSMQTYKEMIADFHSSWEQCPRCGHWDLLVFRGKKTAIMDCYHCAFWNFGPKDMEVSKRHADIGVWTKQIIENYGTKS
jgi:hypothetical protein